MMIQNKQNKNEVKSLERLSKLTNITIVLTSFILATFIAFSIFIEYKDVTVLILVGLSSYIGISMILKRDNILFGLIALMVASFISLFVLHLSMGLIDVKLIIFPIIIYVVGSIKSIEHRDTECLILFLSQIISLFLLVMGY